MGACEHGASNAIFHGQWTPEADELREKLVSVANKTPYLLRKAHPAHVWIARCSDSLVKGRLKEAAAHLSRLEAAVEEDRETLADIREKFDLDRSKRLETHEFKHLVTYVGFGQHMIDGIVAEADPQRTGEISAEALERFVGRVGGIRELFQQVRDCVAKTANNVCVGIDSGAQVRAYYRDDGIKSTSIAQGTVECIDEDDDQLVHVEFKFPDARVERQVVPRDWIVEDVGLSNALCDIGIDKPSQRYWTMLLPSWEQYVISTLEPCQRQAVAGVRKQAIQNHNRAVGELLKRCSDIGIQGHSV